MSQWNLREAGLVGRIVFCPVAGPGSSCRSASKWGLDRRSVPQQHVFRGRGRSARGPRHLGFPAASIVSVVYGALRASGRTSRPSIIAQPVIATHRRPAPFGWWRPEDCPIVICKDRNTFGPRMNRWAMVRSHQNSTAISPSPHDFRARTHQNALVVGSGDSPRGLCPRCLGGCDGEKSFFC
jgi:hypothetical protein